MNSHKVDSVRKSLLKLIWVVVVLTFSSYVCAVGMGGINVASSLGQPLKAEIELVSVNNSEKASLIARIASPDAYRGAGLEYPYDKKIKFKIESRANGAPYISVSSDQPINDPFISLLIDLSWSSGRLLREYTFLLDPPDYAVEQPKPALVQVIAPAVKAEPLHQESIPASKPVIKPSAADKPALTKEKSHSSGIITVQRGDTLRKIASENKPDEVNLEQMLVALYRANAEEFDGKNMNRIKVGKILRMPVKSEINGISLKDAVKEIHAQTADWNAYRQKLAGAVVSKPQIANQQVVTGKITSSVADKAPVTKESAKEVLKLSKGDAPGDKASTGAAVKPMTATEKKNAAKEDEIASKKALEEEKKRAELLDKNLKDMKRLAQMKAEAASSVKPASTVAAVKPDVAAKPKSDVEPTMVEQILGEPLFLVGAAAVLIGLIGIGFYMFSRRKLAGKVGNVGAITGHIVAPAEPVVDTTGFADTLVVNTKANFQHDDEVDPISEADLFLNFGRDVQAEEILKEALLVTPNNHLIHLKLLSIYANRKNKDSFLIIARQLKAICDEDIWNQAAAMGHKLDPSNPLYGVAEDTADSVLDNLEEIKPVQAVDLDFGNMEPAAPTVENPASNSGALDFDITSPESHTDSIDFDTISHQEPSPAVEAIPSSSGDLDFDITAILPPEESKPAQAAKPVNDDMEFMLDFKVEDVAIKPVPEPVPVPDFEPVSESVPVFEPAAPPAANKFEGINLNFDDYVTPEKPAPVIKSERWSEVASKFDLARAYQEMGDATGAREILEEILTEGDAEQREAAQSMLDKLG